jgi:hypothetical protein
MLASKYGKGKGLPLEEPFESPTGAKLLFPGDSSLGAGAAEIVHCRCRVSYNVNFRDRGER